MLWQGNSAATPRNEWIVREWEREEMESSELSLKEMSIGERMILAAQLAVARHWFNAESERRTQAQNNLDGSIGGADHARITDDPRDE